MQTMKVFIRKIYILGLLFALAGGVNTYVGYRHLEVSLQREMERSIDYKLEYILSQITLETGQAGKTLDAADILLRIGEVEDHVLQFFMEVLEQNPSYLSIYLGTPGNVMINGSGWMPPEGFDLRTRPWYELAVQEGGVIFTEPYLNASKDNWVITIAKPVFGQEQELLGVLGIDQSLQRVLEFLESEKASENGHSFLFDQAGGIISDPSGNGEAGCTFGGDLTSRLVSAPHGFARTKVEGSDGYLRWQTLEGSELIVGTFAPTSDFVDLRALGLQLISTTLLIFLVVLALLFIFMRQHIVGPMMELGRDIMGISVDEDPGYRLPFHKYESFGSLRETINLALSKTQEHFEHVMYQQEELSAAYAQLVAHEEQLQAQYNEIKQHEAHAQFLAEHDSLTGLYNRRKFEDDLRSSLEAGQVGAVFMLDIDDFKNINDTQGHIYGDRVLQSVAQLLEQQLCHQATVYRFGGDEFLVLIEGKVEPGEIRQCVDEVVRILDETSVVEGRHNYITTSIGVVRYPFDGTTVDELLIKADIAMHNAKKTGKNRYLFFEGSMATTFSERVQIERTLVEAIQTGDFMLLYQPIVATHTGAIAYFEALIRIKGDSISPTVFIAIAEESNLILPIGRWVIKEAIGQLIRWAEAGKTPKPISLNLSPKQFYDEGLVDFLTQQLNEYKVDPGLIEMEITESVFIDNAREAIEIIERIKGLGIKMALDDFGTGYSSMNYITSIPVDRIKLDRSMTDKLLENIPVLGGLIAIAHGLGMDVVAEGVERVEEAGLLSQVGCDYLQGYLFSPPIPPKQAEQIMDMDYGDLLGLGD